jgi:class 3 adenylate cyclase
VRRLAAIVAADISGYSRLMQLDEEGTHARVTRQRRELMEPNLAEHNGKLITYTGDGFLAMLTALSKPSAAPSSSHKVWWDVTHPCRATSGSYIG